MRLLLHLTVDCNQECDYCYQGEVDRGAFPIMSLEIGRAAIDWAFGQASNHLAIIYTGGEPLLQSALLFDLAEYAREKAQEHRGTFVQSVNTNGQLLDDDMIDQMRAREMWCAFSIDGTPAVHDQHRRRKDNASSYATFTDTLPYLLDRLPGTLANMIIMPDTSARLVESVSHVYELGFRNIGAGPCLEAEWSEKEWSNLQDAYINFFEWHLKTLCEDPLLSITGAIRMAIDGPKSKRCAMANREFAISPAGDIYPCLYFVGDGNTDDYSMGNVCGEFDEEKAACISRTTLAPKIQCEGCDLQTVCNAGCGCVNLRVMGTLDRVSPNICRHTKVLAEVAKVVNSH
ncbi:radical SAM protein [Candidatus Hydrogenedentota bacterium]